ncbi:lyase [Lithospermum erythrorhizon]|uniref:rhamnogalacturonan endolyase n=1 Tax=Lithospermum erythrorhizon TaxID=34254 RepID=A0AAV3QAM3_LITER
MGRKRQRCLLSLWLGLCSQLLLHAECYQNNQTRRMGSAYGYQETSQSSPPVKLDIMDTHVVMDNGIVKITLHNPTGELTGIQYNGIDNLLESNNRELERGYWDIMWNRPGLGRSLFDIYADPNGLPLNYDKRFILLRGSSGFYTYAIYDHLEGWPALILSEGRLAFKLSNNLFKFMAISDDMQTIMPSEHDLESGTKLDYREATLLRNPQNAALRGQVDDKYQYSMEHKDDQVHGWISSDPHTGFWVIIPSHEFRAGGPVKLELTAHSVSTCLVPFFTGHYIGRDMGVNIEEGQPWKKVFGPVSIYLNSDNNNEPQTLWRDAKRQMLEEKGKWPYDFPLSLDYPHANQRGVAIGRLMIQDRYIRRYVFPADSAFIGLAPPGSVGSWQTESNGYQFWTRTDANGYFNINNVRPGTYNLYAWVPGILGDYKYDAQIHIRPGSQSILNVLTFEPPRDGPTLWEIGIPDRTAAEFFIPDPNPGLRDHIYYTDHREKYRQYGLWSRYTDLYPNNDLVYTIGTSDYRNDWFFAHVSRRVGEGSTMTFVPTTWQITFQLANVDTRGMYTLRIALASANYGRVQVRINDPSNRSRPNFITDRIGDDNVIARHGIHGLYWLFSFQVPGFELYIRLEGPGGHNY